MIVFECIGMAWHAIPSALACLYHPPLQDKENMVRHIASNAKTAGKSERKMEDRRGAYGGTYLAALSQLRKLSLRVYVACCHGPLWTCPCARCSVATLSREGGAHVTAKTKRSAGRDANSLMSSQRRRPALASDVKLESTEDKTRGNRFLQRKAI